MTKTKTLIKKIPGLKTILVYWQAMKSEHTWFEKLKLLKHFSRDWKMYHQIKKNENFKIQNELFKPMIFDRTDETLIDPVYFYQNAWCARKVFENKPTQHVDVGSDSKLVGILSQFVPTTMVDIRPVNLNMSGFSFVSGDITSLPFKDREITSLGSICVIEHIGLGRYGDTLDQFGTEKAASELVRVLSQNGNLYISVPVDNENRIYFNAHRAFTRDYVLSLFSGLKLIEEKYIYGREFQDSYTPSRGFGTGLFHFKKI